MTARSVALRMLAALFGPTPVGQGCTGGPGPDGDRASVWTLSPLQEEGVRRVRALLEVRGGAILADSVGLGKTFIGLRLVEERLAAGGQAVVVVPASLRAMWRRELRHLPGRNWLLVSHTALALGRGAPGSPTGPGVPAPLVVVDEAHRFRNPRTARYGALARLAEGADGVLLVTATPVNNRPSDLLHLVRLFADDDAFADAGVPSLRGLFDGVDPAGLRALVRAAVVRRTRRQAAERFPADPGGALSFPRRALPRVVPSGEGGARRDGAGVAAAVARVLGLELLPYALAGTAGREPDLDGPAARAGAALVRLMVLKRLDSSPRAVAVTARRLGAFLEAAGEAARAGRLLLPGRARPAGDGDPLQLEIAALVARPPPPALDLARLAASVDRDRRALVALVAGLDGPEEDARLAALRGILHQARPDPVLVFTEYRDTAAYLAAQLGSELRVGRIDGSGAWLGRAPAGRRAVVDRFAYRANHRPAPPERERVDVLIATDVLAEGLNLQDARHVVSYDLPWNPVRLLQRIGRADRLGSPHRVVVPWLFAPGPALEEALGIRRRLGTKLGHIADTVGVEAGTALLERLAGAGAGARAGPGAGSVAPLPGDAAAGALLERLEAERDGADDPLEALRTLWLRHRAGAGSAGPAVAALPVPADSAAAELDRLMAVDVVPPKNGAARTLLLEVRRDGRVAHAGEAAVTAVRWALEEGPLEGRRERRSGEEAPPPDDLPGDVHRRVWRFVRDELLRPPPPSRLRRGEPALRLARRLRGLLAEAGAALDPGTLRRADRALAGLARPQGPTARGRLAAVLDAAPAGLGPLLDALEGVGSDEAPGAGPGLGVPDEPGPTTAAAARRSARIAVLATLRIRPGPLPLTPVDGDKGPG